MDIKEKKHWLIEAVRCIAPVLLGAPDQPITQELADRITKLAQKVYVPLGVSLKALVVSRGSEQQIELMIVEDDEEIGTKPPVAARIYPTVGLSAMDEPAAAPDEEPLVSNDEALSQALSRLLNLAQGQVQIKFNPHKDARQTIEEFMVHEAGFGGMDGDELADYTPDEIKELLEADTLVVVEVSGDPELVAYPHLYFYGVNLFTTLMKAIERLEAMGDDEEGDMGDAE